MTEATNVINEHEISELMNVWPALLHDLINTDYYLDLPDVSKWMVKVIFKPFVITDVSPELNLNMRAKFFFSHCSIMFSTEGKGEH